LSVPDAASYVALTWVEANFSAGEWTGWIAILERELANFHIEGIPARADHSRAITHSELLNLALSRRGGFSFPPRLISRGEQHGEAKAVFTNVLVDRADVMSVFPEGAPVTNKIETPAQDVMSVFPESMPVTAQIRPMRRGRKEKYDWDEAKMALTGELNSRGDYDEPGQTADWNCQSRAEDFVRVHFEKEQHGGVAPSESAVRKVVRKTTAAWRESKGQ
jgi:hypothetical protein